MPSLPASRLLSGALRPESLPRALRAGAALAGAGVLLAACGAEPEHASLLVPEDVEVVWVEAWNAEEDGLAAAVPVDLMVYGDRSGEPVEWAKVGLEVSAGLLAPPEAVALAGSRCAGDCWWDAWHDTFVEVDLDRMGPSLDLRTDAAGLARVYVVLDALPEAGSSGASAGGSEVGFEAVEVDVWAAGAAESFRVLPR